jgi:hypothetical protein
MAGSTERTSGRPAPGQTNLSARVGELSIRLDRLARQVESLTELVRGQNELLQRQYRLQTSSPGRAEVPPARLASHSDPAGPSESETYADLVIRIRALVRSVVPAGATVLVASKGDDELLLLEGRVGWHFPQGDGGVYSGHHPADSAEATRLLEKLRRRGATFFVLPTSAFWWLDHYAEFAAHLTEKYRVALRNPDACLIFDLRPNAEEAPR